MSEIKRAIYSFQRDGHTDSIQVSRNQQIAGSIRYDGKLWTFHGHGLAKPQGTVATAIGEVRGYVVERGHIVAGHADVEQRGYPTLAEAIAGVLASDSRAGELNAVKEANRLLPNFRKYTRHANAR